MNRMTYNATLRSARVCKRKNESLLFANTWLTANWPSITGPAPLKSKRSYSVQESHYTFSIYSFPSRPSNHLMVCQHIHDRLIEYGRPNNDSPRRKIHSTRKCGCSNKNSNHTLFERVFDDFSFIHSQPRMMECCYVRNGLCQCSIQSSRTLPELLDNFSQFLALNEGRFCWEIQRTEFQRNCGRQAFAPSTRWTEDQHRMPSTNGFIAQCYHMISVRLDAPERGDIPDGTPRFVVDLLTKFDCFSQRYWSIICNTYAIVRGRLPQRFPKETQESLRKFADVLPRLQ